MSDAERYAKAMNKLNSHGVYVNAIPVPGFNPAVKLSLEDFEKLADKVSSQPHARSGPWFRPRNKR